MRPAGAPASSPPVISTSVDARPGAAYTVAGMGRSADLGLTVYFDRRSRHYRDNVIVTAVPA
jgi:hypothetical protein